MESNDNRPCWACDARPAEHRHQPVPSNDRLLWLCDACHQTVQAGELWRLKARQAGRAARAKAGKRATGHTPYGWDCAADGTLTESATEQRWLTWIFDQRRAGMTYYGIAHGLNERGVKTKVRGIWHPKTVAKILARGGLPTSLLRDAA